MDIQKQLLRWFFEKTPVIIFAGQSGCGKNTQAKSFMAIHKELCGSQLFYSETGNLFRQNIPQMTEFNKKRLKEINDSGGLQSWVLATSMWSHKALFEYNGETVLIDGSPRTEKEARAILSFFRDHAQKEIIVFAFELSDDEAERRMIRRNEEQMTGGEQPRADTATPEARKKKLAFFHTDVVPAIDLLKTNSGVTVHSINAEQSPGKVFTEMVTCLMK